MYNLNKFRAVIVIIVFFMVQHSFASSQNYNVMELKEIDGLIKSNNFSAACTKLEKMRSQEGLSENLENSIIFYLGKCNYGLKKYDEALLYFRKLSTDRDPEAEIPTLETAKTYLKLGEFFHAERFYKRLLKDETVSDEMKVHIEKAVDKLPSKVKISHTLSVGINGDNNVNSGPANSTMEIFNLPFTVSESSLPQKDVGSNSNLSTKISKLINTNNQVSLNVGLSDTSYTNHSVFGTNTFSLSGNWFHKGSDFMISTSPYLSVQWLDKQPYSTVLGLSTSFIQPMTNRFTFVPYVNLFHQNYRYINSRINSNIGSGASLIFNYDKYVTWSTQLGYNHSSAKSDLHTIDRINWNIKLDHNFRDKFHYRLGFGINNASHEAPSRAFQTRRYDIQYNYNGAINFSLENLGFKNSKLEIEARHINNRSNHQINERTRTIYGMNVITKF